MADEMDAANWMADDEDPDLRVELSESEYAALAGRGVDQ
jgi:hypothetical protein